MKFMLSIFGGSLIRAVKIGINELKTVLEAKTLLVHKFFLQ